LSLRVEGTEPELGEMRAGAGPGLAGLDEGVGRPPSLPCWVAEGIASYSGSGPGLAVGGVSTVERTPAEAPDAGALGAGTVELIVDGAESAGTEDVGALTGSSVVTVARDPDPQLVHGAVVVAAGLA
jgi:hypothetical protein